MEKKSIFLPSWSCVFGDEHLSHVFATYMSVFNLCFIWRISCLSVINGTWGSSVVDDVIVPLFLCSRFCSVSQISLYHKHMLIFWWGLAPFHGHMLFFHYSCGNKISQGVCVSLLLATWEQLPIQRFLWQRSFRSLLNLILVTWRKPLNYVEFWSVWVFYSHSCFSTSVSLIVSYHNEWFYKQPL